MWSFKIFQKKNVNFKEISKYEVPEVALPMERTLSIQIKNWEEWLTTSMEIKKKVTRKIENKIERKIIVELISLRPFEKPSIIKMKKAEHKDMYTPVKIITS